MPVLHVVLATVALLLVDVVFSAGDFVESPWAALPSAIAVETIVLVAVLALATWRRPRPPAWLLWTLATVFFLVAVVRVLDITVPWFFWRRFSLVVDARFVPVLWDIATASVPPLQVAAACLGLALALVAAVGAVRVALGLIARAVAVRDWRPFAVATVVALVGWLLVPPAPDAAARALVTGDTAEMIARQAEAVLNAEGLRRDYLSRIQDAAAARSPNRDLALLRRRNVVLVFVESYGAVTFTEPRYAAQVDPARARMEARLASAGFRVATDTIQSPITGGGSWFAHTTMLTGIRIDDQAAFDVLMTTRINAIGHDFLAAGWRTAAVMPKIERPWPEGHLLGFERIVLGGDMGYAGPRYSWESMPDQFALDWLGRNLLAPDQAGGPRFVKIVLASSHVPWDRVPAVVEDWAALGDGRIYATQPDVRYGEEDGYLAAIVYDLDALGRFIAERVHDDTLFIVLGDHQPPLAAARATRDRSVPISVISRDRALIAPFLARGFVPGLRPGRMIGETTMAEFRERFVADFSRGPVAEAPSAPAPAAAAPAAPR